MQLTPTLPWALVRRALYMMMHISQMHHALVSSSPSAKGAKRFLFSGRFNPVTGSVLFPSSALPTTQLSAAKTPMEIREEDYSFQDGAHDRPVIQVVTKDVKTADIFMVMQAIGSNDEIATEDGTSWWRVAVTEEFTRQDLVVLALIALCILRSVIFVLQVMWKLMSQWCSALKEKKKIMKDKRHDVTATQTRKQFTIVRFCHLQFLLVIEKLKREMKDGSSDAMQQMVAELVLPPYKVGAQATLTEILATVRKIQAKDSSFKAEIVQEDLTDVKQHMNDEEEGIEFSLPQAWEQLHQTYASFLRIQATIFCRRNRKKSRQVPLHHYEKTTEWRQRRYSSSEDLTDAVLQELHELTKELPQGFTADMFTSLGSAMHKKAVAIEPETSPTSSQEIDADLSRDNIVANIPKAAKYSATALQAA